MITMDLLKTFGLALALAAPLGCSNENREVEAPDPPSQEPLVPAESGMSGSSNATQGLPQTETNTPSGSSMPVDPGSGGTRENIGIGGNSSR